MPINVSSGDEHDKKVCEIGHDAFDEASIAVKKAMIRIQRETTSKNGADIVRASFYGGLGALVPCAMLLAKRKQLPPGMTAPEKPENITAEHGNFVYSLASLETLTLAGILLAQMLEKISFEDNHVATSIAFGPIQIREALRQWKKLFPLAKPEDWFEEGMIQCVAEMEEKANVSVNELMAKLKKASPGSSTFH